MNNLMTTTQQTMSSLEIAELTGKEHKNVVRDIEEMLSEIGSDLSRSFYLDKYKRKQPKYNLNKELTYTLVAGYSTKLRNVIIKRWLELEEQQQPQLPQTYAAALRAHADEVEKREALQLDYDAYRHEAESYQTILAFFAGKGVKITAAQAAPMGKKASQMCRVYGHEIKTAQDDRYKYVNSYPVDVLEALFGAD